MGPDCVLGCPSIIFVVYGQILGPGTVGTLSMCARRDTIMSYMRRVAVDLERCWDASMRAAAVSSRDDLAHIQDHASIPPAYSRVTATRFLDANANTLPTIP